MSLPRVILLAAGQGSRLGAVAAGRPKALMPVGGEPLLLRTLRQLRNAGARQVTVVVGYKSEMMEQALSAFSDRPVVKINDQYATDTNIGSLLHGLAESDAPALVIEADIAFEQAAVDVLVKEASGQRSVWFTTGPFAGYRLGGCLRSDASGRLVDLRYVRLNTPEFAAYRKLLGSVFVGPSEMPTFHALLRAAAKESTAQYYMMPWCEHLAQLPAWDADLFGCRTATFNTPEEYRRCITLFEHQL